MSGGNSNVMLSSSSSSSSSSSAATKIGKLIEKMNATTIKSCVIGISKLSFHWLHKNISHTALFISDLKRGKLDKKTEGILLEYGNYPPDEAEAKKKEEEFIKNGDVIYRYGNQGGLRYYTNTFGEYRDKFCDIGYISLNVGIENQKSFSFLIEKLAPISEKVWIKAKYAAMGGLFGKSLNCQTFVCNSIDIIKPTYDKLCITKGKDSKNVDEDKKESIVPDAIKETLKKYEDA